MQNHRAEQKVAERSVGPGGGGERGPNTTMAHQRTSKSEEESKESRDRLEQVKRKRSSSVSECARLAWRDEDHALGEHKHKCFGSCGLGTIVQRTEIGRERIQQHFHDKAHTLHGRNNCCSTPGSALRSGTAGRLHEIRGAIEHARLHESIRITGICTTIRAAMTFPFNVGAPVRSSDLLPLRTQARIQGDSPFW